MPVHDVYFANLALTIAAWSVVLLLVVGSVCLSVMFIRQLAGVIKGCR